MATIQTWYCGCGNNVFSSDLYSDDNRPDCAACGRMMTANNEGFDSALELIEAREIETIETQGTIKQECIL